MQAIAISNGYTTGKVYVIWEIPHDKISGYEIYRDGQRIASSLDEDGDKLFEPPTMFDHDHQTNLFRKDSRNKLMYTDEKVQKYQNYKYEVIAFRKNENDVIVETISSDPMYITAQ